MPAWLVFFKESFAPASDHEKYFDRRLGLRVRSLSQGFGCSIARAYILSAITACKGYESFFSDLSLTFPILTPVRVRLPSFSPVSRAAARCLLLFTSLFLFSPVLPFKFDLFSSGHFCPVFHDLGRNSFS